jgi:hypothetical protein
MDEFLTQCRKDPSPQFAKSLYERIDKPMNTNTVRKLLWRWRPTLVSVGAVALLLLVFSFPATQALAQEFLNVFRVKRFSVITLDPARMEQLRNNKINLEGLIGDQAQVTKEAGEPQVVAGADAAASIAGIKVRVPATLPDGVKLVETRVQGAGSAQVTADMTKLQAILDTLNIKDVKAPTQLNGAHITLNKPALVMMRYTSGREAIMFFQAKSPEVVLPQNVKISDLALIGLRIVGLSPQEAQQYARTIDWNTTMLVPIPVNAGSFREVDVRGVKGLLITSGGTGASSARFDSNAARQQTLLLWAENDMVYALQGGPGGEDILQIANALK